MNEIIAAYNEYQNRQTRASHPAGRTDSGGRWYPAPSEWRPCCDHVRSPSRHWPWSLMAHCRTMKHVAWLYGVTESELRRYANSQRNIQDQAA